MTVVILMIAVCFKSVILMPMKIGNKQFRKKGNKQMGRIRDLGSDLGLWGLLLLFVPFLLLDKIIGLVECKLYGHEDCEYAIQYAQNGESNGESIELHCNRCDKKLKTIPKEWLGYFID